MGLETLAIGGLGALGSYFGNKKSARTQTTDQKYSNLFNNTSGTKYGSDFTTTPTEPEAYKGLGSRLLDIYTGRLGKSVPLEGYEASGISNINKDYGLSQQTLDNKLAARGLSRSPVAADANARLEAGRVSDVSSFQNTLPLLQRYYEDADLDRAAGFYGKRPLGTTGTASGTSDTTSSGTASGTSSGKTVLPGSAAGGVFNSLADWLKWLYSNDMLGSSYAGG